VLRGARQRYHGYLDEQKRVSKQDAVDLKQKKLSDELQGLKKKRATIETDVFALEKSADELSEKAEKTSCLTFISKSNSLQSKGKKSCFKEQTASRALQ